MFNLDLDRFDDKINPCPFCGKVYLEEFCEGSPDDRDVMVFFHCHKCKSRLLRFLAYATCPAGRVIPEEIDPIIKERIEIFNSMKVGFDLES